MGECLRDGIDLVVRFADREGQKLLFESAAVLGFFGAALMAWGIVGGLIAWRSAGQQQESPGSNTRTGLF